MSLSYPARSVSLILAAVVLQGCTSSPYRVERVNGTVSLIREGVQGRLSTGTSLRRGDLIQTGEGNATLLGSECERFEVYPRSSLIVHDPAVSCIGSWLMRLKAALSGLDSRRPQPARVPVIAVRG